ncbi:hypothetical protein PORCRE_1725 [Porphyromonas crevioricanis JCM 15906]|uniref:Uncharacterized protein n=1 Tax=Porphyromonas crevioricanis JCM 15906 TaxID=1305617 RepID=T1DT48_9PORP|nr:hypothetical protein PORCRE_1725 [Porphyromonas crevioricanis JCM 15906]
MWHVLLSIMLAKRREKTPEKSSQIQVNKKTSQRLYNDRLKGR